MRSLAALKRGSSQLRRCGSSRRHSKRDLSRNRNSSRALSSAAAEAPEGRAQKAHAVLPRVLSNSTKLRNARADRLVSTVKAASSVKNAKFSARLFDVPGRVARGPPFVYGSPVGVKSRTAAAAERR